MRKKPQGTFQEQRKEPVIERITMLANKYPSRSSAARAWGVNVNTLKSYYRKEGEIPMPRDNLLSRIAQSEGVSLEWLKFGENESPKKTKSTNETTEGDQLYAMLRFLTPEEREQLITVLARKGVETVLLLLEEDNIRLMQLDRVVKDKILSKSHPTDDEQVQINTQNANMCSIDSESEDRQTAVVSERRAVS